MIEFQYDYLNGELTVDGSKVGINLGNRVQIDQILPLKINNTVYQFIKYNYESAPD